MIMITGVLAIILTSVSLMMRDDEVLRRLNLAGVMLWTAHYAMIGAWPAVGALLLATSIIVTSMVGMRHVSLALVAINLIMVPLTAVSHGGAEALSAAGSAAINFGVAMVSGMALTLIIFGGQSLWIIYAVHADASFAVVNGLICLAALIVRATVGIVAQKRHSRISACA